MKRTLFCLLAMALTASNSAGALVPSKIREVTVFSDRARVVRTATAAVGAGLNEVRLEVTAFQVDPESVMARIYGEGELYGVQYKQVPVQEPPTEKIRALEKSLRELRRGLQALTDQTEAVEKQRAFLDSFIEFAKVQVPREIQTRLPDAASLETTLAFLDRGFDQANRRLQTLAVDSETRQREIEQTERELAALRGGDGKTLKIIEVLFQSRRSQQVRIEAEYQVAGAAWRPLYKASVPESADAVDLTMLADIRQKSGEDWQDVKLAISNALPLTGGRLPDLSPWVIDMPRPAPPVPAGRVRAMAKGEMAAMALEDTQSDAAAPAPMAQAEAQRSLLAVQYTLPQPVTVDSRDQETVVPVFTKALSGTFHHLAVPKIDPQAYFVCRTRAEGELLSGPLQVHFAGQYLGKSRLEQMRAGAAFYLNLGVDRGVLVRREKIADNRRETFFGRIERDTVVREVAYRISVENTTDREARVHILDHAPISRTDRIRIEDLRCEPVPTARDDQGREGVLRWERSLAPGAKETLEIHFTVAHPKDMAPLDF